MFSIPDALVFWGAPGLEVFPPLSFPRPPLIPHFVFAPWKDGGRGRFRWDSENCKSRFNVTLVVVGKGVAAGGHRRGGGRGAAGQVHSGCGLGASAVGGAGQVLLGLPFLRPITEVGWCRAAEGPPHLR